MNRSTANLRILIADEHAEVRRGVRKLLKQRREWSVCGESATGKTTVEMARLLQPDIVYLDLSLPGRDAVEVISEIMGACPAVKIVILAEDNAGERALKALAAGAIGLAMKSDAPGDLLLTVQNIAKNRRFISPAAEKCIRKYVRREMKKLVRARNDIDRAIAYFELLKAQLPEKGERPKSIARPKSGNLIEMTRKHH